MPFDGPGISAAFAEQEGLPAPLQALVAEVDVEAVEVALCLMEPAGGRIDQASRIEMTDQLIMFV